MLRLEKSCFECENALTKITELPCASCVCGKDAWTPIKNSGDNK